MVEVLIGEMFGSNR